MISHRRRTSVVAAGLIALATGSIATVQPTSATAVGSLPVTIVANGVPLQGATVAVPFSASATSSVGPVSYVKWVLDGTYIAKDTSAPFEVTVASLPAGAHHLRARVYTASGQELRADADWTAGASGSGTPVPHAPAPAPALPAPAPAPSAPAPPTPPTPSPVGGVVNVRDGASLAAALTAGRTGTVIQMADGVYTSAHGFVISRPCTATNPCVLRGSRSAILDGGGFSGHYGLHVTGGAYWTLQGFSVRNASKGIVLDGTRRTVIDGVDVFQIGDEGIHLRSLSTDNVVRNSLVHDTGRRAPQYGEGIYIGSAKSNWGTYSNGAPDRSDRNVISANVIFATGAESVDIKEGTTGGSLLDNSFDGAGMSGLSMAKWMSPLVANKSPHPRGVI